MTYNAKNSTGAGASSCSRPDASPARPTAQCSPPGAKPLCSATVVAAKEPKPGQDFFPLTVHYQEKAFAAGRIPGGYLKREGRMSDRETLTSRLIDRPIRPLFPEDFRCDTQVIATVFSYDLENDSDILAMIASFSRAHPLRRAVHGSDRRARVGLIKGEIKVNPTVEEMKDSTLDLVVAGTADAVLMVESEAQELSEDTMLKAVMAGHAALPAGDPGDHPARRKGRQGAARTRAHDRLGGRKGGHGGRARPISAPPTRLTQKQDRYAAVDAVKAKVMARARARRAPKPKFPAAMRSPRLSTTPKPKSCAGTFSITSAASTGAI